ncbi:MAG TPA: phosphatase PAP2 family protein [Clostridiales bacterium]|nr:phosphatase PAP2 family protein [Clostridiales bacterium]
MKSEKKIVLCAVGLLVVLMIIFSFTDLAISTAIYNPESLYGKFFEAFGEFPGILVGTFSIAALIITRNRTVKWKSAVSIIGYGILLVLFGLMNAVMPFNYLGGPKPLIPVVAVLLIGLCLYGAGKIKPEHRTALKRAAIIGLFTFLCAIIIVNIIKNFWGRPRFRSMVDPLLNFTAWYLPQGIASGEEFRSFPSGHSANSAVVIWISLLPTFLPSLKGKERPLFIGAMVWTLLVMFSRVVMGAHFASDVMVGVTITLAFFLLLCKAFKPVKEKMEEKQEARKKVS